MSALTDLFTALANKIRSKTGEATTYTPLQMVSDGIDDVYQAGVDAGETPTQTKTVTAGTSAVTVTPDTGYALSSVTVNPTPSQSKVATPTTSAQTISPDSGKLLSSVSVGAIPSEYIIPSGNKSITSNGTGIDVSSYATANVNVSGTSITPSNTSPASMSGGTLYTPSASGYAISSYDSVTPSSSGAYFSSGMKKMASSGYAYSSQPVNFAAVPNVFNYATISANDSTTIAVSQSPRFVILARARVGNTSGQFAVIFFDIVNGKRYYVNYDASGFHDPALETYVMGSAELVSVSSSSVSVKNTASYQIRQYVLIWY